MSQNAKQAAKPKQKKTKRKSAAGKANFAKSNIGVGAGKNTSSAKPNRNAMGLMSKKLTGQESGIVSYLMGLSTPSLPCRVPVVLGPFELDTNTYSYVFNGAVSCGANGFGFVGAVPDGWLEGGNDGGPAYQFLSNAVQGYPLWTSVQAGGATTTPPLGSASGAVYLGNPLVKVDNALTLASRYRMTSIILSVWPDSPATTTQGDLCLATLSSEQALADGPLNGGTFATVAALPQEYVTHVEMPLANWNPEHQAHAFPVPFSESCFTINYVPSSGTQTCGAFAAVAIISGAASGQTFRYRCEYKYETTAPVTFMTGQEFVTNSSPVSAAALVPHLSAMKPMSAIKAPAKHLSGVPLHAMKTADPALFGKVTSGSNLGSVIGKAAATAVSAGIKQLPYVGAVLGGMFDSIFS